MIVRRLTALCISFNRKVPDPNLGGLNNQEKFSQFSATPHQLPNMRRQFYSNEFFSLDSYPSSYKDRKECL